MATAPKVHKISAAKRNGMVITADTGIDWSMSVQCLILVINHLFFMQRQGESNDYDQFVDNIIVCIANHHQHIQYQKYL
ncbi:hypothetical protein A1332_08125 [Methylomonas methanica]|uniref:Uncharacterized protein n=2 Tax=Methylomonas methanica TaxID=421 RepID=A0A177MR77_METMH|nr:hypothetical protein A1332_08125 [Methylomonas methanica]